MVLLASLALAAFAAAPASAAPAPVAPTAATFGLSVAGQSGALRLRSAPGRTVRGAVRVRNLSGRPVVLRLQPADIANATNGNADYVTTRRSAAGRWVRLAATTVRLAPKASRKVPFSVRIPIGTRGASHYAGIVAFDAADVTAAARDRKRKGTSFTISRITRQALPITLRLPGPLMRKLTLRSVKIKVDPAGAGLVLGLRPGGTILTQSAPVRLRVSRGPRTILRHSSTLGQLFPGDDLAFRIPWTGRPTEGVYRVRGVIRPMGSAPVYINRSITFTPAKANELKREAPPVAQVAPTEDAGLPMWVWLALAGAAVLLLTLSLAVWRLARRGRRTAEAPASPLMHALPDPDAHDQDDRHDRTAA
ncbi:MAG: hypothetical protein Q8K79_12060 [Solirubrobacteraceae bacterium]|nr:hypothetical protein [Solirubrobacteraceae bacterium]